MQLNLNQLTDSEYARLDKSHPEDSGYNLYVLEPIVLYPGVPVRIKHGIAVEPPAGYTTEIRPRSSTLFRRVSIAVPVDQVEAVARDFNGDILVNPLVSDQEPYVANLDAWREVSVPVPLHVQFGTVDQNYRGELMTAVVNFGRVGIALEPGDRISQLVLVPVQHADVVNVNELTATARGAGGFGSTGR